MNDCMTSQKSAPVSSERTQELRIVTLCGSIKPLFSGTDDFHENLVTVLRQKHLDVRPLDQKRWGLGQVPSLLREVAAERPDAILMQYPTDAFSAALGPHAISALQHTAPLIITLHEFASANPIRRASMSVLLARAAAVITTAETERKSLLSWFPWLERRIVVIPIAANFPAREWQPTELPLAVYFGQIRPEKGLEDYMACQEVLAPRFVNTKFVIAGSRVPKFSSYFDMIEVEARKRGIELLSEMKSDQVSDFLRTATIALLPFPTGASFRRGTLLAAAGCGVPIVTLRGAETPAEIVSLLKPATSRDGLIDQVATYLSDTAARTAAHEASRQVAALVSWDTLADRYIELFSRVTARGSVA